MIAIQSNVAGFFEGATVVLSIVLYCTYRIVKGRWTE